MQPSSDELQRVVDNGVLSIPVAVRYLTLYLGDANWKQHIDSLWTRFKRQNGASNEELAARMRKSIACAALLPTREKVKLDTERPENLLHRVSMWDQFKQRDWFDDLQKVVSRDISIKEWRKQTLQLGVIDPIEDAVWTRQAFNWLYGKAEETGCVSPATKDDVVTRHSNMVKAYGGACISNIFMRHEDAVKKVHNWRTGYFFERAIYEVYTPEQVLKIKRAELTKTNVGLIHRVKVD